MRSNRFSVRVDRTSNGSCMFLGLHSGDDTNWQATSFVDRKRGGYYFYPYSGYKSQVGGLSDYCAGARIVDGDVFTVIKEGRSISFEKNGVSLGVAFADAPEGDMFPYVELNRQSDQMTLV